MLSAAPGGAFAFSKAVWGNANRNGVDQFPLYRKLGASILETRVDWASVAPHRPRAPRDPRDLAYHWPAEVGIDVARAQRFHMRVLIQLMGAPPWANGGHDWNWAPHRPSDFAAFATAASRRYPNVHLWMVWGEPNGQVNWQPIVGAFWWSPLRPRQVAAPHLYARVLDAAYGALKAVSRRNLVLGGCTFTNGALDPAQWIRNLRLPDGRAPRMDMYAHNPFSRKAPDFSDPPSPFGAVQFSDLPELARMIDHYLRPGLPIFLSEWTIPTAIDVEFNFYVDAPVAAQWIRQALSLSRRWHRIYALGWIHIYDNPPWSYGGLLTADGVPKQLFDAFRLG